MFLSTLEGNWMTSLYFSAQRKAKRVEDKRGMRKTVANVLGV